jgi:hypothetical protein
VDQPNTWRFVKAIQELKADNDRLHVEIKAANDNHTADAKAINDRLRVELKAANENQGLQEIEWVVSRGHSTGSMHDRTLRRR